MYKNTIGNYGCIAKFFHWLMAFLFIGMFLIAYIMINIPKSNFRYLLYDIHKATGLLLIMLMLLRVIWRFINIQPTLANLSLLKRRIATWNTFILYMMMVLMPLSGFLTSMLSGHDISFYGIFTISPFIQHKLLSIYFSISHEFLSYILVGIVILHILAALYHHYYLRDNIFNRMWFFNKEANNDPKQPRTKKAAST